VEACLREAYRHRKFTVVVLESAPSNLGQSLAAALSASSIPTLLIPDSALFAILPQITKVLIGAHIVLPSGGMYALSGSLATAMAAKELRKPVLVATGQFKFSLSEIDEYEGRDWQSPDRILDPFDAKGVQVENAYYDYVGPELVGLYVTEEGDHMPAHVKRVVAESYDEEDFVL